MNFVSREIEQRWRDVEQPRTLVLATQWTIRRSQNNRSVLRVIATIGPGIVFLNVNRRMPNRTSCTPVKSTEMDDQVRSDIAYIFVKVTRFTDQRPQALAFLICR